MSILNLLMELGLKDLDLALDLLFITTILISSSILTFLAISGIGIYSLAATTPQANTTVSFSSSFVGVQSYATHIALSPSASRFSESKEDRLSSSSLPSNSGAKIWTDKSDYPPGSLVTIYGSGFNTNSIVSLTVTNPDNSRYSWSVISNSTGGFTTTFQIDISGYLYTVITSDGQNTATTTFTDSPSIVFQSVKTTCAASATCSPTAATTTTGDLLVVIISYHGSTGQTISSVDDTAGNSATPRQFLEM